MDFVEAEINLVKQLDKSFIFVQMYPEFSSLDTKTKILVARKRLWFLMDFLDDKTKGLLLNSETAGLLSVLKNRNQKPIHFQHKTTKNIPAHHQKELFDDEDAHHQKELFDDEDDGNLAIGFNLFD